MGYQFDINNYLGRLKEEMRAGVDFETFLAHIDIIQQQALPQFEKAGYLLEYAQVFLLKVSNFLVGKYQFVNRHHTLLSRPYALFVDPSNNCPLHCSGCLHNKEFQQKIGPDWPGGNLNEDVFRQFISSYGPYASNIVFYNWGEPLLNKNTPRFISMAKSYMLRTSLSSNLSIDFDAEALVLSGLDYMVLSIDGATKKTYSRYRQGGDFHRVIDNVKRLVNAKKKHNKTMPWLSWQYLLFEHNKEEVFMAKQLAEELGVDEIRFSVPYDVLWDDEIIPASKGQEEVCEITNKKGGRQDCFENEKELAPECGKFYEELWLKKFESRGDNPRKRKGASCQWLYNSIVMDALGRYMPCCYVPRKKSGFTYVFSNIEENESQQGYNSEYFTFSRKHFTWLSDLIHPEGSAPQLGENDKVPYCVACPDKGGISLVNDEHVRLFLHSIDKYSILTDASIEFISNWKE